MNKKQYFQQNFSKLWLYFIIAISLTSWSSLIFEGARCKPGLWFYTMEQIQDFISLILLFLILMTCIFIISSFFINLGVKKIFALSLFLAVIGFFSSGPFLSHVGKCPDSIRMADLRQIQLAEQIYFQKYNKYATYEELEQSHTIPIVPRDYKGNGEFYPFLLSADKQNFEAKGKLDKGTWYICDKDKCGEYEEK